MDPVSAISLLASIGQLIGLTAKHVDYINKVHKAPKDRAILAMEASTLLGLLTKLRSRAEMAAKEQDPWFVGLQSLAGPFRPLDQLKVSMIDLTAKFEPKYGGALIWPFTEKSIKEILMKIEENEIARHPSSTRRLTVSLYLSFSTILSRLLLAAGVRLWKIEKLRSQIAGRGINYTTSAESLENREP